MDKNLTLGRIQTIKNNYALAQAGIGLLALPNAKAQVEQLFSMFEDHTEVQAIRYIGYVFEDDSLLKLATQEFRNAVLRNCLKEVFELVKLYGSESSQKQTIQAAPWYQFLRIVRNCLSHDLMLRFTAHDLKVLPVSWSGLTIDASMDRSKLPMRAFLTRMKTLELVDEVSDYIRTRCA